MFEEREDNIVRMVYTYTSGDPQLQSAQKPRRKGITRIAQTHSHSQEKPQLHSHYLRPSNDQNNNLSNRQTPAPQKPPLQLIDRVKELERQILRMQKERIEHERECRHWLGDEKLIESQYVACNEDAERWMRQRQGYLNEMGLLRNEKDFLGVKMTIQEQYINKIQCEIDELRSKQGQRTQTYTQTEEGEARQGRSIEIQTIDVFKSFKDEQLQCNIESPLDYLSELQQFSDQMSEQTQQFSKLVLQLQAQNGSLKQQKDSLLTRVAQMQTFQDRCLHEATSERQRGDRLKLVQIQLKHTLDICQEKIRSLERGLEDKEGKLHDARCLIDQLQQTQKTYTLKEHSQVDINDHRYLLRKVDDFQMIHKRLSQQLSNAQLLYSDCQLEKSQQQDTIRQLKVNNSKKEELLERTRTELLDLSEKYEAKVFEYADLRQQHASLMERLNVCESLKEETQQELDLLSLRYSNQVEEIERNLFHMQDRLQLQIKRHEQSQLQFIQKMQLVKKDYDVLYAKYIKYKHIATLLQPSTS